MRVYIPLCGNIPPGGNIFYKWTKIEKINFKSIKKYKTGAQQGDVGRGESSSALIWKSKKVPWFWKKKALIVSILGLNLADF